MKNLKIPKIPGDWDESRAKVCFLDNLLQNVVGKVKKLNNIGQDQKTFIPVSA